MPAEKNPWFRDPGQGRATAGIRHGQTIRLPNSQPLVEALLLRIALGEGSRILPRVPCRLNQSNFRVLTSLQPTSNS